MGAMLLQEYVNRKAQIANKEEKYRFPYVDEAQYISYQ